MTPFIVGIVSRLKGGTAVTNITASYAGEEGVFSGTKVPPNATMPYCYVHGPTQNQTWEDKDGVQGFEVTYRIASVAASKLTADKLALAVHERLHRQTLTVSGYAIKEVRCGGPMEGPGDEEFASSWVGVKIKAVKE